MLSRDVINTRIAGWAQCIEPLLANQPQGIREHDVILELRKTGQLTDLESETAHMGGLFVVHFLVRHVLYRMRETYRREGQWDLLMGPVHIQRLAYRPGEQGLTAPDSLSDYYLDIDNLFNTSEEEVDAWLDDFWARYLANDEKQAALDVLGLSEPLNKKHVERRYRQLAMQHHPDRGGDTKQFQEINAAMRLLERSLH